MGCPFLTAAAAGRARFAVKADYPGRFGHARLVFEPEPGRVTDGVDSKRPTQFHVGFPLAVKFVPADRFKPVWRVSDSHARSYASRHGAWLGIGR